MRWRRTSRRRWRAERPGRRTAGPDTQDESGPTLGGLSIGIDREVGYRLGPGKIRLLGLIAATGSISAAGRAMAILYRRAWLLVDGLNSGLRAPVVAAQPAKAAARS